MQHILTPVEVEPLDTGSAIGGPYGGLGGVIEGPPAKINARLVVQAAPQLCRGDLCVELHCPDAPHLKELFTGVKVELSSTNFVDSKTFRHGQELEFKYLDPKRYLVSLGLPPEFELNAAHTVTAGGMRVVAAPNDDGSYFVDVVANEKAMLEI